ncbi:MAG: ribosomal protein [Nitrospirae bacterium]|nr:ribosomal protein [Nitrospirota bacterium]
MGLFSGPVGVAIGYDDPVLLARKVLEFSKSNEKLEIKGGAIEGELCSFEELKIISALPSREIQLSMLASAMQSPLSKLASLMNATLAQFVYALGSLKQKREA